MKPSKGWKIAATVILAPMVAFWLIVGVSEMINGDFGGAINLIIAIAVGLLSWLGWKRPLLAGLLLSAFGILLAMYFLLAFNNLEQIFLPLVLMCAPPAVGGLILTQADWVGRKH